MEEVGSRVSGRAIGGGGRFAEFEVIARLSRGQMKSKELMMQLSEAAALH